MNSSKSSPKIHVLGTDAAGPNHLSQPLQEIVLSAKWLAVSKRLIKEVTNWWKKEAPETPLPNFMTTDNPKDLISWLHQINDTAVVLTSGDPLWFGIGRRLLETFGSKQLLFHPAPSSLQLAFSKLGRPWQDASWISLHGREQSTLAQRLQQRPPALAVLTDPKRGGADEVRRILKASGLQENYAFWICEQLGHHDEKIYRLEPNDLQPKDIHPLHLVLLIAENKFSESKIKSLPLFGIEDGFYQQHADRPGLMTKREVRIQLLADLELPEHGVLWDIGAGVGSIGLEALRLRPNLKLLSIEKRGGGASVINNNASRLNVRPLKVLESDAIEGITNKDLPPLLSKPDRVILGCGGPGRVLILKEIIKRIQPKGIIVIPLANIEALRELKEILISRHFQLEIRHHQSCRGMVFSDGTRLAPMNPVIIIKAKL